MAVRISLSNLTAEQKKKIASDLNLKATQKTFGQQKFAKTTIINFFITDNEYLYLPFNYAAEMLGNPHPNNNLAKYVSGVFGMTPGFTLRDYQSESLKYAMEDFALRGTAFFNVYCSYGKTVVGACLASWNSGQTGTATLVLVPLDGIVDSWVGAFKRYTTAKVSLVGKETPETQVIICPCHQIGKLSQFTRDRIGFLIIDEADTYCTAGHVATLLGTTPYKILALTATYERDDGMEQMLDKIVGLTRIVKISSKPFFVLKIETNYEANDVAVSKYGISYTDLIKKLAMQPARNELIMNIVINNLDQKILILTVHKEHALLLLEYCKACLPRYGKTYGRYFDIDKTYNDCDVLICTYAKTGRGFDQESKCKGWDGRRFNMLIRADSTVKEEQAAGRVFRADIPWVIDIVDSHENVQKHWRSRYKWYVSRNGIVKHVTKMFYLPQLFATAEYQRSYLEAKQRQADDSICPVRIVKVPKSSKASEKYEKHDKHEVSDADLTLMLERDGFL